MVLNNEFGLDVGGNEVEQLRGQHEGDEDTAADWDYRSRRCRLQI